MRTQLIIPGLDDDEQAVLSRLVTELRARQSRNALRSCYYDGKRAISQVGTVIPPQYFNLGIVLGWSAKAVDLLARRCTLEQFVWPEGDLEKLGAADVWKQNKLRVQLGMARTSSLIHGPSFLINTRGADNEPKSLIHVKDALNATGEIDERTWRMQNLLSVTRWAKGEIAGLVLYLEDLTISAEIGPGGKWAIERSEHSLGVPAEALVYKQRIGRPFGSSRISRPVMSLHDQALRAVIRLEGHMDVYSYPELWLLGADERAFKNADGTPKTSWQVMLGRIKALPDLEDAEDPQLARADVKQFQAASPQPHLAALNAFAKLFAREASLPDSAVAITDVSNPTSAESYDASQYELIAEAEGATDDWSPAVERCFARALAIQNDMPSVPPEFEGIAGKWRDPRYLARSAQADAGMKQLSAIPWLAETEVGLELLGLTDQQIARAMSDRRRVAGRANLDRIAAAAGGADSGSTAAAG